jgi:O-antigen biosynthesis protein
MNSLASPAAPRLVVERRNNGLLVGWMYDPASAGEEVLTLSCQGQALPVVVRRFERDDVAEALHLPALPFGFEMTLPWQAWRHAVADGQALLWRFSGADVSRHFAAVLVAAWPTSSVGALEGLSHLHLRGWYAAQGGQRPTLRLRCEGVEMACPSRWVERMDVAAAHWLPSAEVGFEIEIPGHVWQLAGHGRTVSLQVLVDGEPLGDACSLASSALHELLRPAARPREPRADALHCALVMEHVVMAGVMHTLSAPDRVLLGVQCAKLGLSSTLVEPATPAVPGQVAARLPGQPKGVLGRVLQRRWSASLALSLLQRLRQRPERQDLAERLEIVLTRATGLLDKGLYLSQLGGDELRGQSALRHYVTRGDDLSLVPNRLLDPRLYTGQLPGRRHPGVNRLLHYALWGRFAGLRTSVWFDSGHYLRVHRDVAASGIDPLRHFINDGWREARSPVPGFAVGSDSGQSLLKRLSRLAGQSGGGAQASLDNFLLSGLPDGAPLPLQGRVPWVPHRVLDGQDFLLQSTWQGLAARSVSASTFAVIVPVYAGVQETLRCLWAVLSAPCRTPFELLVVDDCSPDPALSAMLVQLAQKGLLRLLVNPDNLGFVRTVNRALEATAGRDVVILNADTCVANDWLDRLLAHAQAEPLAASITPLSNNATLCSYPQTMADNGNLLEMPVAELDLLAARTLTGLHVQAPTGVGFCMYLRRQCLDQVGLLDAERFGRGYGEENDWCLRASDAGWVHLLAADVVVLHDGGVSFAGESSERATAALAILAERYPDYQERIRSFERADPLLPARLALDLARLVRADARPRALLISHARGGGTARYEQEEAARLDQQGRAVILMRPGDLPGTVSLNVPGSQLALPNLRNLPLADEELIESALRTLGVNILLLNHLVDFPAGMADRVRQWGLALAAPLRVMLHDYHAICPRINLVTLAGRYCGEPAPAACNQCLQADQAGRAAGDIVAWRRTHEQLLLAAQSVAVPDEDVAQRLQRYFPRLALAVQAHEAFDVRPPRFQVGPVRKLMVVGALSQIKGYDVVLALLASSTWRDADAQLSLLGYSLDDEALLQAGAQVLGRYDDAALVDRLVAEAPDLVWLPSIWPETYNYVLSAALQAGCRVAVFDIGAPARRLRHHRLHARILPLALADDPEALAAALLQSPAEAGRLPAGTAHSYTSASGSVASSS